MKIFRFLNEHPMAAPCKKLTMSRGDDGDAGGMMLGWPVLRGDGCAMWRSDMGALARGRRGSKGYACARLGRLPPGVTTRLGLPPGWDA